MPVAWLRIALLRKPTKFNHTKKQIMNSKEKTKGEEKNETLTDAFVDIFRSIIWDFYEVVLLPIWKSLKKKLN